MDLVPLNAVAGGDETGRESGLELKFNPIGCNDWGGENVKRFAK
jgi:hypothetical protein